MNQLFLRVINKYRNFDPRSLASICFVFELANTFIFSIFSKPIKSHGFGSITEAMFVSVLFAPIVETYIFQQLFIRNILKIFKNQFLLSLFLSALFFGLMHWYSIEYIFKTFISGLIFGFLYLLLYNDIYKSFWYVYGIHALHNLIIIIIRIIF